MKAAYVKELGPPERIIFGDRPEPVIDASQALIKVVAVAVDPLAQREPSSSSRRPGGGSPVVLLGKPKPRSRPFPG